MDIFDHFTSSIWIGYVVLLVSPCLYVALWIEYVIGMLSSEWRSAFKVYSKGNYSPMVNIIESNQYFVWTIIWPVLVLLIAFGVGMDDFAKPEGIAENAFKDYFTKHCVVWFFIGLAFLEVFFSMPIKRIIKEQKLAEESEKSKPQD